MTAKMCLHFIFSQSPCCTNFPLKTFFCLLLLFFFRFKLSLFHFFHHHSNQLYCIKDFKKIFKILRPFSYFEFSVSQAVSSLLFLSGKISKSCSFSLLFFSIFILYFYSFLNSTFIIFIFMFIIFLFILFIL